MTLLEKIRMWWQSHFRTVKIYTHLQELIADLRAAGLSQRANEVEKTLIAGSFADELLEEEAILLRNIVKEETLSPSLKRKIRRIQIESWGILSRILRIDASEVVSPVQFFPAPKSIVHPKVDYTRAHKWVSDDHCDEDFCFVKCRICGKFALIDEEIDTIYLSADNPGNAHLYGIANSIKCPSCSSSDSFEDTSEDDAQAIRKSEWAEFLRDGTSLRNCSESRDWCM